MVNIDKADTPVNRKAHPSLIVVLYLGMAGLLFLALYHYKLRTAFSDTPYYIIDMTRSGAFAIAHNRFVGLLSQWLPSLLLQMHMPLRALAVGYSFAYSLSPVLMCILAIHWLKQPYTALAILLLFTLMNVMLFYYPVSELQMGLGLLLLYNGILDYCAEAPGNRKVAFVVSSLLIIPTVAFAHPMVVPTFAGWVLYRAILKKQDWRLLGTAVGLFAISAVVKKLFFVSGYESGKGPTWEMIRPWGLNYFTGPLAQSFYKHIMGEAFMVLVLLIATIAMLIYARRWLLLTYLLLLIAGLFSLVMITFEDFGGGHIYDNYYEQYLQPSALFLILTFSIMFARLRIDGRIKAAFIAIVLLISLAKINTQSEFHKVRQKWEYSYLSLMDSLHIKKAVVGRIWIPEGWWKGSYWSASTETLFLSSLEGREHSKTLFLSWNIDRTQKEDPVSSTNEFLMDGWHFNQSTLPDRYFALGDKPYVVLEHTVPDSVLARMMWP